MTKKAPSKRDRQIIKKRVNGETMREIAAEIGTSPGTVCNTLKRLDAELAEALKASGYGLHKAVTKMAEMADAEKTEFFAHKGVVIDQRNVADNGTRLQARREMLRLHRAYPETEIAEEAGSTILQIVVKNIGTVANADRSYGHKP